MKAIYKSVALLFGAMSLFSSCEDFLTRDPQDSYLLEDFLNSDAKLSDYTKQVCGPLTWNGFDDKTYAPVSPPSVLLSATSLPLYIYC